MLQLIKPQILTYIFYFIFLKIVYFKTFFVSPLYPHCFITIINIFRQKFFRYFKFIKKNTFSLEKKFNFEFWPYRYKLFKTTIFKVTKSRIMDKKSKYYRKLKKFPWSKSLFKFLRKYSSHPLIKLNFLKFVAFKLLLPLFFKQKSFFSLKQRVFLNKKAVDRSMIFFFYKKAKWNLTYKNFKFNYTKNQLKNIFVKKYNFVFFKKQKLRVIFLNFYKKLYWKIRKSRHTHWNYLVGNRLNKYRYQKFFSKISMLSQKPTNSFYALFISHISGFYCSWKQIYLLSKYQLVVVNGKNFSNLQPLQRGDIIESCYGKGLFMNLKLNGYFGKKIFYKMKRWSYKIKLNYELPKHKRKFKKIPKNFKSLMVSYKPISKAFMFSKSLGLATVIYPISPILHNPHQMFFERTILKLNTWRYKF